MPSHKNNADIYAWKRLLTEHNTKVQEAQSLYEMSMSEIQNIATEMDDERLEFNYDTFVNQKETGGFWNPIKVRRIRKALTDEMKNRGLLDDEDMWESADLEENVNPSGYETYHKSYTDALNHALEFHREKHGLTISDETRDQEIAMGNRKRPNEGESVTHNLPTEQLVKNRNGRRFIHITITNLGNDRNMPYELVTYSS